MVCEATIYAGIKRKKKRKIKESKLISRPDMKKILSDIDYAIYGAAKTLPKKGEITFLRENSEELEQADLSEEEKGSFVRGRLVTHGFV